MSLEIIKIEYKGDAKEEYILLKATKTINVSNYAIVDRTFDEEGNVSNIYRHFYRFPAQQVQEGEYVSLWTGKGIYNYGKLQNSTSPVHRFYWGSEAPIWNDTSVDSAELLEVKTVARKTTGHPAPKKTPKLQPRLIKRNPFS